MKFRTKPVEKEAIQWTGNNRNELAEFMGTHPKVVDRKLRIHTLEGAIYASEGDWVIKGLRGEFYPCKPDIFEKTYEPVEE